MHSKSFTDEIQAKAGVSFKWSALGEGATRLSQPLLLLVLSRLLTPGDFGLVAVAIAVIGIAQVWQDFGLGKTLVQTDANQDAACNVVFWLNLTLSIVIYTGIAFFAEDIAAVFRSPDSVGILRVLTFRIVISGLTTVQQGILQRALDFRTLFLGRMFGAFVPVFVTVPLAVAGQGVWSIVIGSLCGAVSQSAFLWWRSSWRPSMAYDRHVAGRLIEVSKWIFCEGILTSVINWGDSIIVARYLGAEQLGIYQLASTLVRAGYGLLLSPTTPVAYVLFARLRQSPKELFEAFSRITSFILMLCCLGAVVVNITAYPGLAWFLGQKWEGADVVVAILVLSLISDSAVCCVPNLLTAIGRPDLNVKALLVMSLISIPAFIIGAGYGLVVFTWVRVALILVDNGVIIAMASHSTWFNWRDFLRVVKPPIISAIAVVLAVHLAESLSPPGPVQLAGEAVAGALLFLLGVWFLDPACLRSAYEHAEKMVGSRLFPDRRPTFRSRPEAPSSEISALSSDIFDSVDVSGAAERFCARHDGDVVATNPRRTAIRVAACDAFPSGLFVKVFMDSGVRNFYWKLMMRRSHALREREGWMIALANRIPAPAILHYAEQDRGLKGVISVLIGEFLHDCETVESCCDRTWRAAKDGYDALAAHPEMEALLIKIFEKIAAMHLAGVTHGDLHLSNVLVRTRNSNPGEIFFTDFSRTTTFRNNQAALNDIGYFLHNMYSWQDGRWIIPVSLARRCWAAYREMTKPVLFADWSDQVIGEAVARSISETRRKTVRVSRQNVEVFPLSSKDIDSIVT